MKLVQRYGDFGLIPRNLPDSCRSCCDRGMRLRQSRGRGLDCVVKGDNRKTCARNAQVQIEGKRGSL